MKLSLVVMILVFSLQAQARCSRQFFGPVLSQSFKCVGKEFPADSAKQIPTVNESIFELCRQGCNKASGTQLQECQKRLAGELLRKAETIQGSIFDRKCSVDTNVLRTLSSVEIKNKGDENSNKGPFASCFFVTEQVINPASSSCGNTSTCVAVGYCKEGQYAGSELSLLCDAVDGRCPSFEDCANADDPSWITRGARGTTKVNRGINLDRIRNR